MNEKVTLIKRLEKKSSNPQVLCKCNLCGSEIIMWASHYYRGSSSCECWKLRKNNPRIYSVWTNMKTRCYNVKCREYKNYGGRGIKICEEWRNSFKSFLEWSIENGYNENLSIDRVNVNGNYEPNNCRWATFKEQANNKRNTIYVGGIPLKKFCELKNINYKYANYKINKIGLAEWYLDYAEELKI